MPNPELVNLLYSVGFILVIFGILILAMNILLQRKEGERKSEVGGVILIGPFPIVFGTSRRMMKIMLLITFIFIAIILLTTFLHT